MKLEKLIQKRFISTAALAERLTTYNGAPAVFSSEAPGDEQDGWGGETQYPMVTYNYDLQANEERNSAGSLSVSIFCQNTADIFPVSYTHLDVYKRQGQGIHNRSDRECFCL